MIMTSSLQTVRKRETISLPFKYVFLSLKTTYFNKIRNVKYHLNTCLKKNFQEVLKFVEQEPPKQCPNHDNQNLITIIKLNYNNQRDI